MSDPRVSPSRSDRAKGPSRLATAQAQSEDTRFKNVLRLPCCNRILVEHIEGECNILVWCRHCKQYADIAFSDKQKVDVTAKMW